MFDILKKYGIHSEEDATCTNSPYGCEIGYEIGGKMQKDDITELRRHGCSILEYAHRGAISTVVRYFRNL